MIFSIVVYIKIILRPVSIRVKKYLIKLQLLRRIRKSPAYFFVKSDINLFLQELFTPLPVVTTAVSSEQNFQIARVKDVNIFWPSMLPTHDLPWLYHEVFDDFDQNPSSYNHPKLDYENATWIVDAGAAEGFFSIFALQHSMAHVYSIEPLLLMRDALSKTLHQIDKNRFSIISAGLSEKSGFAEIELNNSHICDSKIIPLDLCASNEKTNGIVEIFTLDELATQYKFGAGGVIKMDIEGFEMSALAGASNLLRTHKPQLAIAVYHDLDNAKLCASLIKEANPAYQIEFRGCFGYCEKPRPYMLFAY